VLEKLLNRVAGQQFHNTSKLDFASLAADANNVGRNLAKYIKSFSPRARDILDHFGFAEHIEKLDKANRLYLVIKKFAEVDLHPDTVPNQEMGYVFEELIRKYNEDANETAGDHFTPREWIIENDYLECIIALPDQLFYNTGIFTYIWIVTNRKTKEREGKVQLIDATSYLVKMRKSLGNKRNEIGDGQDGKPDHIAELTRDYEYVPLMQDIHDYFDREVKPHVPEAWIDESKRDEQGGEVGIVGYEIPLNRHFYVYQPPRALEEIEAEIAELEKTIVAELREVVA